MEENINDKFMRRCLDLALKSEGMTYPNPLVGSVIVHEGLIIGEGYHLKAGMTHAEVNAIKSVKDRYKLKESTLYVNLEPCSHFGKTPPCADMIIKTGIKKVIVGTSDTSEKVAGNGIRKLREAGCEVIVPVLGEESRWVNRRFFTFNEKKRPYIILKWAQSPDHFIDTKRVEGMPPGPNWISGKPERVLVHRWRASEQSILVGAGTVRTDNPRLNVREWKGHDPLKLILSGSGIISGNSRGDIPPGQAVIFTHNPAAKLPGADTVILNEEEPSCFQVAGWLWQKGIQSLFIEGGATVFEHFISNDLWDEARIFTGKEFFTDGVKAPWLRGKLVSEDSFSGSMLQTYINE